MSRYVSILLACALAVFAAGCVISKEPVFGPDTRALPFASGARFQVYERDQAGAPWKASGDIVTFVADAEKVVRALDDKGKPDDQEAYTFHPIGPDRYLVQARFEEGRHAYSLLVVGKGEAVLTVFQCKRLDRALLKQAGVAVDGDDCVLDRASDPAGFLRRIAEKPNGSQIRYVPVAKR